MMHAIEDVVSAAGFRLVISSTGTDPADQIDLLAQRSTAATADGLILVPLRLTDRAARRPQRQPRPDRGHRLAPARGSSSTTSGPTRPPASASPSTTCTQGRRRIAFVNGPVDTVPGTARLPGYLEPVDRLELPTRRPAGQSRRLHVRGRPPGHRDAPRPGQPRRDPVRQRSARRRRDQGAARHGPSVPDDVAVVGMDDTQLAELTNPSLTSVGLGPAAEPRPPPTCCSAASPTHRCRPPGRHRAVADAASPRRSASRA